MSPYQRTPANLLRLQARTNPASQALIDAIPTMDHDDIDQISVPMKWVRDALHELRREHDRAIETARVGEIVDAHAIYGVNGSGEKGEIRVWQGGTKFIAVGRSQIEIKDGKLLWFPLSGGFWFETAFSGVALLDVYRASKLTRVGTKSEYMAAFREQVNGAAPANLPFTVVDNAPPSSTLAGLGVTVGR